MQAVEQAGICFRGSRWRAKSSGEVQDAEILFVGAEQGIEARLVPQEGFPLRSLPAGSMKGVGWSARLRNLAATVKGILGAKRILKEFQSGTS